LVALVTQRLPAYLKLKPEERLRSLQVLAPARKGECGVVALNNLLQETLNPARPDRPSLNWGDTVFRLGDKVMQTKNDYQIAWSRETAKGWEDGQGVFNGDVGFVTKVDTEEHTLTVRFDDDKDVVYGSDELENLDLAYCLSVHKSQGSEFPCVIMPVFGGPPMLLTRNLFYTAMTRARQLVVLVGRDETVRQMVQNDYILKRNTALAQRIVQAAAMTRRG
jgi:exodeoxyribonuclease V alpha subunit